VPRIVVLGDPLSAEEHNDLGVVYELKGMNDLAQKEYSRAAALKKDWHVPLFNLGNLALRGGDLTTAEKNYRNALDLDPQNADVMNNLALTLHEMGRNDEARALIEQALAIECKEEYLDSRRIIFQHP